MIERFYVHNYRCLESFELPIGGRSAALLVGKNGTGKSTLGSALEILQSIARGKNRVRDLVGPKDFFRGLRDAPMRIELSVGLAGAKFQYVLAFELPDGFRELRVAEERLTRDGQEVYSRDRAQVRLARTEGSGDAGFSLDWHLVALPLIQDRSELDPIAVFRTWLARMLILAPIPSLIDGDSQGDTLLPDRVCARLGEWLTGLLAHSPGAYSHLDSALKDWMPDLKDIKNPLNGKDTRSILVQFEQGGTTLVLPFAALSDGEKCYFICALVLAANAAYGPLFCFWDEPDSHLSLSEIGHFILRLRRSLQSGSQLLATSHNPETIRHFARGDTLLLFRRGHLEPTLVRPASEVDVIGDLVDALIRDDVVP